MARASLIFLVMESRINEEGDYECYPKAAFTVEQEMISWLKKYVEMFPDNLKDLYILAGRDGALPNEYGDTEFDYYGEAEYLLEEVNHEEAEV